MSPNGRPEADLKEHSPIQRGSHSLVPSLYQANPTIADPLSRHSAVLSSRAAERRIHLKGGQNNECRHMNTFETVAAKMLAREDIGIIWDLHLRAAASTGVETGSQRWLSPVLRMLPNGYGAAVGELVTL